MRKIEIKAKILRGKRKGETVILHQFCNDWATLEDGTVKKLSALKLDDASYVYFLTLASSKDGGAKLGQMFTLYYDFDHFFKTGLFRNRVYGRKR